MLIEFLIKNYKSIKEEKIFSMVASNSIKEMEDANVITEEISKSEHLKKEIRLLKSAVIYGANASGKSNLLDALRFIKKFVITSATKTQSGDLIPVTGYKLNSANDNENTVFEIHFIDKNIKYRYGFELNQEAVHNEWLFFSPLGKEANLFVREGNNFKIGDSFKEGKGLENKVRQNALYLSVAAQFNVQIAIDIIEWFRKLIIISGLDDSGYMIYTQDLLKKSDFKNTALQLLKIADIGIEDIILQEKEITYDKIPDEIKYHMKEIEKNNPNININNIKTFASQLLSSHKKYNENNSFIDFIQFDFRNESQGTIKLLAMTGPILDALLNGSVLVVDELDARLHPLITKFIIQLFNSKNNKNRSQLIFATHDTNLLNNTLFRRDQIWFTEKNKFGATDLYSLSDYKVRANASFSKDYIQGKYGAIPFIGDNSILLDSVNGSK